MVKNKINEVKVKHTYLDKKKNENIKKLPDFLVKCIKKPPF